MMMTPIRAVVEPRLAANALESICRFCPIIIAPSAMPTIIPDVLSLPRNTMTMYTTSGISASSEGA